MRVADHEQAVIGRLSSPPAALLVAIDSLFQIAAYSLLGWFYLSVLPGWLGLDTQGFDVSIWEVARTTLIFLGIPLAAGWLTRTIGIRRRGRQWYEQRFLPRIGPLPLYGLLFTIVMLLMFAVAFATGMRMRFGYPRTATLAFTAASNNFELAIAVAVGVFGATSGQALAGVVGPLIEVPVLVGLVYVALWVRPRLFAGDVHELARAGRADA